MEGKVQVNGGSGDRTGSAPLLAPEKATPGIRFISGHCECEGQSVIWEIGNIAEFLEMSQIEMEENAITFNAGHSIGVDTTWTYYFTRQLDDSIGAFLKFEHEKSKVKSAYASYSVTISSEGENIASFEMEDRKKFGQATDIIVPSWGWEKMFTKSGILEKTKGTNTVVVTLNMKIFSNKGFKPVVQKGLKVPASPSEVRKMKEEVNSDFAKLLESKIGNDVDIIVPLTANGNVDESEYTREAHKAVLMARSSVFAKMFSEDSVENRSDEVVIKELSPKGLDVFLHYLYTGEVLQDWLEVPGEILTIADKYDCGKLKQFCGLNLISAVKTSNAWDMYDLAKQHKQTVAASAIAEFISKNTEAVLDEYLDEDESDEDDDDDEEESEDYDGKPPIKYCGDDSTSEVEVDNDYDSYSYCA